MALIQHNVGEPVPGQKNIQYSLRISLSIQFIQDFAPSTSCWIKIYMAKRVKMTYEIQKFSVSLLKSDITHLGAADADQ